MVQGAVISHLGRLLKFSFTFIFSYYLIFMFNFYFLFIEQMLDDGRFL